MPPWNSARTKVQIRLSIQRLRSLQEKKLALAKKSRREIADLLLKNRVETARLRVEGLIQDDIYVELLELLELYCELLQARFNLLDSSTATEPEPSISDAVCSIVYAAPRTELKELHVLREFLMHKYGRNFALSLLPTELTQPGVPSRVLSKMSLFTPSPDLVDAYLSEIARGYNVPYESPLPPLDSAVVGAEKESSPEDEDGDGGLASDDNLKGKETGKGKGRDTGKGKEKESDKEKSPPKEAITKDKTTFPPPAQETQVWGKKDTEEDELARRFAKLKELR
ncbi:hypothetical protein TREMEDRAFT_26847 [Tremella mesenterica DSM 1558]|uniref:uncharacterized protein n=1 Tax=Tremella mesenterica (strain ATCC 24925 / CBS 8224 / DSM 1558 / NBRC 9311 / NRRL Y-6157 / RJB 2259-6 / UBC 559-6) TaxID=578456 RepID=UPI0003F491B2|nr:uncharacterized protein TREMEDRAFT_26847 [Tremella mesenterica DSM 1558]EIW72311.1 hypothetical protein TREMEDRAFT_26847 [Tremella mesenterica DSM 1558]